MPFAALAEVGKAVLEVAADTSKEAGEKVAETAKEVSEKGESIFPEFFKDIKNELPQPHSLRDLENTDNSRISERKQESSSTHIESENKDSVDNKKFDNDEGLNKGLTEDEKRELQERTGWSSEIIDHIESMEQYEVYKNANLHEAEIDGRKCLLKDIDMDYVDPKTGMTNRELMERGRSPIDPNMGEKIELHHMGQDYDAPFAELCENSEHGDGNHSLLHTKYEDSWRNNPELKNQYNNVDKPNHWKERAKEA